MSNLHIGIDERAPYECKLEELGEVQTYCNWKEYRQYASGGYTPHIDIRMQRQWRAAGHQDDLCGSDTGVACSM